MDCAISSMLRFKTARSLKDLRLSMFRVPNSFPLPHPYMENLQPVTEPDSFSGFDGYASFPEILSRHLALFKTTITLKTVSTW